MVPQWAIKYQINCALLKSLNKWDLAFISKMHIIHYHNLLQSFPVTKSWTLSLNISFNGIHYIKDQVVSLKRHRNNQSPQKRLTLFSYTFYKTNRKCLEAEREEQGVTVWIWRGQPTDLLQRFSRCEHVLMSKSLLKKIICN